MLIILSHSFKIKMIRQSEDNLRLVSPVNNLGKQNSRRLSCYKTSMWNSLLALSAYIFSYIVIMYGEITVKNWDRNEEREVILFLDIRYKVGFLESITFQSIETTSLPYFSCDVRELKDVWIGSKHELGSCDT